jgi:hypothetical protein
VKSASKLWLGYLAATLALSVAATFLVRGVWGAESPWWYFLVSGVLIGSILSSIWIKAGWWG